MKRIMMVLMLLWGITAVAVGQERIKKVVELKNGTTIMGYVIENENGDYMVETEVGDVLFYTRAEVRVIRNPNQNTDLVLPSDKENIANTTLSADLLRRGGFGLKFQKSKEPLRPELVSEGFWQEYNKASKKKKSGMIMMICGVGSFIGGIVLTEKLGYKRVVTEYGEWEGVIYPKTTVGVPTNMLYVGYSIAGVGCGLAILGTIYFFSGNSRLKKLATQFNNEKGYASELSLDYSPTSLALVYKF